MKSYNGIVTKYHLVGDKVTYEDNGIDNVYYTYDSSAHLVSMNLNGVEYYYIRNAQGDIIGLFDKSGSQVVSYTYDTWGKLISIDGSLKDSVGVKNPYRYRGYRYDTETGLYYLQSRYYNPEFGRFINADALGGSVGELLSHNVFAYCKNNPVNLSDPSGYLAEFDWDRESKYTRSTLGEALNSVASFGFLCCAIAELFMGNPAGIEACAEKDIEVESRVVEKSVNKVATKAVKSSARNLAKSRGVPSTLTDEEAISAKAADLQMSMKKINDNYLKRKDIDAHELKANFVGKNISKYDLYVETDTGEIYIFLKGGKGQGLATGEYIK